MSNTNKNLQKIVVLRYPKLLILILVYFLLSFKEINSNVIDKQQQRIALPIATLVTTTLPPTSQQTYFYNKDINNFIYQEENLADNSIESNQVSSYNASQSYEHVPCGTLSTNSSKILVNNPNYPETIYTKTICETVIERSDPTIKRLIIRLKQLELYRPNFNGQCLQDRFAIYTDLNALLTPVMCGNNTGKTITILFPLHTSVIISVTTSDLDHDRSWSIEIEQEH